MALRSAPYSLTQSHDRSKSQFQTGGLSSGAKLLSQGVQTLPMHTMVDLTVGMGGPGVAPRQRKLQCSMQHPFVLGDPAGALDSDH